MKIDFRYAVQDFQKRELRSEYNYHFICLMTHFTLTVFM